MLGGYTDDQKALLALNACFEPTLLETELKKRQTHLIRQLIPRFKALILDDNRDIRTRRLVDDLVIVLLRTHIRRLPKLSSKFARRILGVGGSSCMRTKGMRGFCDPIRSLTDNYPRQLFGDLFNRLDDYVLRILVSDILRHLLVNNFDICELWEHSSEEVMDFPNSEELDAETISKIINSMSSFDVQEAFRQEKYRFRLPYLTRTDVL